MMGKLKKNSNKKDLEYVSMDDFYNKKYPKLYYASYDDPGNVAKQLKEKYPDAAIFSNPATWGDRDPEEQIRKQIRDFLEWLESIDQ